MEISVPRKSYSEQLFICWNEASLCISTTTALQVCRIGILLTMDPTLHYNEKGDELTMDLVAGLQTRPIWTQRPDVITETRAQKQTVVSVDREHRDGCVS